MSTGYHRIPQTMFEALAAGGGGSEAVHHLAAVQYSKHLLLLRGVVERAKAAGHAEAGAAAAAYDLLAELQEEAPAAVDAVLRHPSVGAWARATLLALARSPEAAGPGRMSTVAAAAAIRAHARFEMPLPDIGGAIMLPSLGQALLPAGHEGGEVVATGTREGALISGRCGRVRVPADPFRDGPGWRGLRRLSAHCDGTRLDLLIDDIDPYRLPAVRGLAGRLPDDEVRGWDAAFRPAWEMLVRGHWTAAGEIAAALRVLTPLERPAEGHVSATARDAFGCVGLSAPRDAHAFAVTLVHEVQHAKLTAMLEVLDLLRPDDGSRYYAPWRDDPRPASGLLQGAYAYLGVAGFWRRQRLRETGGAADRAHAGFVRWRDAAHGVVRTLLSGDRLTPAGERFAAGMRQTLLAWRDEPVPAAAVAVARRDADRHLARWRRRNRTSPGTA